jgi:hypothetical protein
MRLKRATPETAPQARDAFLDFWASECRAHFRAEEEEVSLPTFAAHASPDHEAVVRVLVEHVDLRRRRSQLARDGHPTPEELSELGERLATRSGSSSCWSRRPCRATSSSAWWRSSRRP